MLFTPNGKLHRYLTKIAFENLLHPFQPFIVGQKIIGPLFALKLISIIFFMEKIKQSMETQLKKIIHQK